MKIKIILPLITFNILLCSKLLIPMDLKQTDHLKAYGITFWNLEKGREVDWLLNYRGGSFMMDNLPSIQSECLIRGVYFEQITVNQYADILATINDNNMDIALLETPPKIAVYSPPGKQPWDDAVTLALTYAEVNYDVIFDEEVLTGGLKEYDWLRDLVEIMENDSNPQHFLEYTKLQMFQDNVFCFTPKGEVI